MANGPEWDDLSFPDGVISLYSTQYQREDGIGYDFEDQASEKHDIRAGAQYDVNTSSIYQIVPTVPQIITADASAESISRLSERYLEHDAALFRDGLAALYRTALSDERRRHLMATARSIRIVALAYTFAGLNGFRANFDHTSTPPLPLEVQRTCPANACSNDSGGNAAVRFRVFR